MKRTYWLIILLLLFGIFGVTSTYTQLSQTADEGYHTWCGLQWWQHGTYTESLEHSPLARIMDAAFPFWLGADRHTADMSPREAYAYKTVLMRLGTLPFYVLSCVLVFLWSRRIFGVQSALWSLALYVSLETVSAHAGLATTDMGCTAMLLWAIMAGIDWLETPTRRKSIVMGLSLGLAIGTKFSVLVQWPSAMALIVAARVWAAHYSPSSFGLTEGSPSIAQDPSVKPKDDGECVKIVWKSYITSGLVYVFPMLVLALGAVYRFDLDPFFTGISQMRAFNSSGFAIWLFGPLYNHAVWYFFPVVYFFKTPIPFHIATILGNLRICREGRIERLFPLLAAMGVLLPSMTSNINLGVRHVLTLYPLLAIPAGYGLWRLWQGGDWKRWTAAGLLGWQAIGFITTMPDHVSYYNELAGSHPERISLDSDYDWDQDLILLDKVLQNERVGNDSVNEIYVCLRNIAINRNLWSAKTLLHAIPLACPQQPVSGWIVVSRSYRLEAPDYFTWLDAYEPVQRIGTLDLYYIP